MCRNMHQLRSEQVCRAFIHGLLNIETNFFPGDTIPEGHTIKRRDAEESVLTVFVAGINTFVHPSVIKEAFKHCGWQLHPLFR